jgi:hypothetical protein
MKIKKITKAKNLTPLQTGFDAVKTMRDIRDQISQEIMNMTFEEEKVYLKKLLSKKAVATSTHRQRKKRAVVKNKLANSH